MAESACRGAPGEIGKAIGTLHHSVITPNDPALLAHARQPVDPPEVIEIWFAA